jgi:transcriptional regulator with XRE-family HTH domain
LSFKEIGSKIQQAREAKGLSQKQLARLVGCSQSALSNYEKGKRRLYLSQLEAIAEALNMPLDYFVEPKTSPYAAEVNNEDKEVLRLLNEIYTLTPDERQDVADFIMYIRWRRYKGGNQ